VPPMALKRNWLVPGLFFACTGPALACTPIISVGFGGLMAGFLVWCVLALCLPGVSSSASRAFWLVTVPIGMFTFVLPMLAPLLFLAAFVAIAFPMHLAVEFFDAWCHPQTPSRSARLVVNGIPLALVLGLGLGAKGLLYGPYGGLRSLVWNYLHEAEAVFFAIWLLTGAVVLVRHRATHRSLWPF